MAGGVHVDHEALETQAQQLVAGHGELVAVLGRLKSQIAELVSSGFVTETASTSFADAHERWSSAATVCVNELNAMQTYLKQTSAAFAGADQAATIKF